MLSPCIGLFSGVCGLFVWHIVNFYTMWDLQFLSHIFIDLMASQLLSLCRESRTVPPNPIIDWWGKWSALVAEFYCLSRYIEASKCPLLDFPPAKCAIFSANGRYSYYGSGHRNVGLRWCSTYLHRECAQVNPYSSGNYYQVQSQANGMCEKMDENEWKENGKL